MGVSGCHGGRQMSPPCACHGIGNIGIQRSPWALIFTTTLACAYDRLNKLNTVSRVHACCTPRFIVRTGDQGYPVVQEVTRHPVGFEPIVAWVRPRTASGCA
jgi:hypothetical protein